MRLDSFDKSVDLRVKCLSVALDEKVKEGRSVMLYPFPDKSI